MSSVANPKKKKKRRLKKLIAWLVVLALAGGAIYLFVWPQLTASATTTYNSYTASTGTISNSLSFSGSISVKNNETMTADADAVVRKIYVKETQSVAAGDKLMRLSTGETLKASFDGQVNEIAVEEGDTVSMNTSLIQIVDFSHMKVSLRVDEYSISDVYIGQACTINVTALDTSFDSEISHINRISSSNGSTAYYTVTAEVSVTEDVLPGMQVTVNIPQEEAVNAVILNKDALSFDRTNSTYVLMKDENDEMQQVAVTIGVDNDNYVEVTAGLSTGDTVYAEVQTKADSGGGLFSSLSSLLGGGTSTSTQQQQQPSFNTGNMPSGFNGGGRQGNSSGGFSGMPGGGMP